MSCSRWLLPALWLAFTGCASDAANECDGTRVRIEHGSGADTALSVCAALAVSEQDRAKGLSGQPPLPDSRGLLLIFPVAGEVCIQNGPVSFAIDVVYAAEDGTVVAVERGFPAGDAVARCHPGVKRVLEVGAAVADGVVTGDVLTTW